MPQRRQARITAHNRRLLNPRTYRLSERASKLQLKEDSEEANSRKTLRHYAGQAVKGAYHASNVGKDLSKLGGSARGLRLTPLNLEKSLSFSYNSKTFGKVSSASPRIM